ncbi:MAG: 4Fe-4S binding protein [Nanobdellota archaeon]
METKQKIEEKKGKRTIFFWRRTVQVFFFLLLVYGGYLYLPQVNTDILPFTQTNPDIKKIDILNASQGYTEVFDTYTPFRTCRYLDGNRIFRACSMHYFTEAPVYGVPWTNFIPHFLFFIILSFIFARFLCGWVCPLGAISDFLNSLRKVLGLSKLTLSEKFYSFLKKVRKIWIVLLFVLAVAIAFPIIGIAAFKNELFLVACQTCPARNIFPLLSLHNPEWFSFNNPLTLIFSIIGILFLVFVLLGFFGKRVWCQFCPNGIILSWFNKGSLITKEKDTIKCTKCGICKRVCPMNNTYVFDEKNKKIITDQNCINCFNCVDKCPEDDCLKVKFAGKTWFTSRYKSFKREKEKLFKQDLIKRENGRKKRGNAFL